MVFDRNSLRWRNVQRACSVTKTLYNQGKRWGEIEVFARMLDGQAPWLGGQRWGDVLGCGNVENQSDGP